MSQPDIALRPASRIDRYLQLRRFEKSGRFYERLGIRHMYRWLVGLGGGAPLPPATQPQAVASEWLHRTKNDARYYEIANLIRGLLYVPPATLGLWRDVWLSTFVLVPLIIFHALCVLTERYKRALCFVHTPDPDAQGEPGIDKSSGSTPDDVVDHWWYTPRKFETPRLFKALGMDRIRELTKTYVQKTREEEGSEGPVQYLDPGSRESLIQFERGTRTGEFLHLSSGLLNVPPIVGLLMHGLWYGAVYVFLIFTIDMLLVILQRYHRARTYFLLRRGGMA